MPKLNVDISKKPLNVVIVAMTALVFLAVFSACLLSARQVCAYAFSSVTSEKSAIETWKPLKAAENKEIGFTGRRRFATFRFWVAQILSQKSSRTARMESTSQKLKNPLVATP